MHRASTSDHKRRRTAPAPAAVDNQQHHRRQEDEGEEEQEEEEEEEEEQQLLPGLPDHLSQICLANVPPSLVFSVTRSWRRLLYSPSFPPFLSLYALLSSSSDGAPTVELQSYNPITARWLHLPPPPPHPTLLLRHPSFISRPLPVQSVAAAGHLVILAATAHRLLPALPRPLVFHPHSRSWRLAPALRAPRRWCAAGSAAGRVYVASGVGPEYSSDVARSVEHWDPVGPVEHDPGWVPVAPMRDGRFSREAVDAVFSRGKLCLVNVKGGKFAREGAVYDVGLDRWEDMPAGMLAGWTGPVAAAESDGEMYVVDEVEGLLGRYDRVRDTWTAVMRSERLRGAEQMAVGGGRVCVVCAGGEGAVVVDVSPARMWVLEPPSGKRLISLHVLPRMSHPDASS